MSPTFSFSRRSVPGGASFSCGGTGTAAATAAGCFWLAPATGFVAVRDAEDLSAAPDFFFASGAGGLTGLSVVEGLPGVCGDPGISVVPGVPVVPVVPVVSVVPVVPVIPVPVPPVLPVDGRGGGRVGAGCFTHSAP